MLISLISMAQEQGFYYGTRFGLGESELSGGNLENPNGKLMWQVGATSVYQFSNNIGISADFLLSGKGSKNSGVTKETIITGSTDYPYTEKISLLTGDVPILGKLSFGVQNLFIKAFAGPSINFAFGGLYSREYENSNYNENNGFTNQDMNNLETMSTSLVYGIGVDVKSTDGRLFFLDLRLSNAMGSIGSLNGESLEGKYLALNVGYLFH